MKIVADSHIPFVKDYFSAYGELVLQKGRQISHEDVKEADILLVRSITPVNQQLLENTKVRFVGSVTAGADHLDTQWLEEVGIQWHVAAGFNAPPVADYVTGIVAALRSENVFDLNGVRAAVIGVGNVGKLVAEKLQTLGMSVVMCDPLRANAEHDFHSVSLDELSELDLITLHVPLVKTGAHPTYHFIDRHFLQRQKPGCVLINASRGSVINTTDLLQYGEHLRWCFDVWAGEPNIDKAVLEKAYLATPHIAGYSVQSKIRGIDMIYRLFCENNIIMPHAIAPVTLPRQQLFFSGMNHHWQDIVLGVFNPRIMTAMMRDILLPSQDAGVRFDEMRNQFNYRHEFGFTDIHAQVLPDDRQLLQKLGLTIL